MKSVDRVLKKYGTQIKRELRQDYRSRLIKGFHLENGIYSIEIDAELKDGTLLRLKPLDIDDLADRYPDCGIGY
jgi:hypothetical protein